MVKSMPELQVDMGALAGLPYEAVKWELLRTAIALSLFDHTSVPRTAEEVASILATHLDNTEHLLNALVALGCLSKKNGCFLNTPVADTYLTRHQETSMGESLLFMENWIRPVLNGGLWDLVKNGPPPPTPIDGEAIWERGARASLNHSRCGRAQKLANYIGRLPEFSSLERMLDIGAGPGIIGIAVAAMHPSLHCILMDRPAVCRVAEEAIAVYGMTGRVKTLPGDYVTDPIGDGYDLIMANYTLNFYRDHLGDIMTKVYRALKPGGVFLVTSDGLTDEKTAPAATVISWLSTALQGMDMSFERGVIAEAMLSAGFVSTQSQMLTDLDLEAHGPMEMIIGRRGRGNE